MPTAVTQEFINTGTHLFNETAYVLADNVTMTTPFTFEGDGTGVTFDGSGHTITVPGNWDGLFSHAISVSNLGVLSLGVTNSTAGWFFKIRISGTATNCYSTGTIGEQGGGIFGYESSGSAINCYSTGAIYNSGGGIFGQHSISGSATNCYSTGAISNSGGGIFGANTYMSVATNCYSMNAIGNGSGGIFGLSSRGTAINCYSTGVIGDGGGGIFGYGSYGTATNCYSTGAIVNQGGGIFGYGAGGPLTSCYFTNGGLWSDAAANAGTNDSLTGFSTVWFSYNNVANTPYLLVANPQPPSNNANLLTVVVNGSTRVVNAGSYAYTFDSSASTIPVLIRSQDPHAIVRLQDLSGGGYVTGSLTRLVPGSNSFTIAVTAQDGVITTSYPLTIDTLSNDDDISSVSVNGALVNISNVTPVHVSNIAPVNTSNDVYEVTLSSNAASVPVQIVTKDPNATISIEDTDLSGTHNLSGSLSLQMSGPNPNFFTIKVVAPNGATATYPLTITNPFAIILVDTAFVTAGTALVKGTIYNVVADLSMNAPFTFSPNGSGPITFEGSGHTITVPDQWPGLFSQAVSVSNLGVLSTGQAENSAGYFFANGVVGGTATNCYSAGAIGLNGGGLFGQSSSGSAINCYSTGAIGDSAGGIFGADSPGNATQCYSTGDMIVNAGGIFGSKSSGPATYCYSTGAIGETAGGIFGSNSSGSATYCYSTGAISPYAGGILGYWNNGNATNCYSTGTIEDGGDGLLGYTSDGIATNCYSTNGGLWSDAAANARLTGYPGQSPAVWLRYNNVPDTPYLLVANPQPPSNDVNLLTVVVNGSTRVVSNGSYAYTFDSSASTVPVLIRSEDPHAIVSIQDLSGGGDVSGNLTGLVPGTNSFTIRVVSDSGVATASYPLTIHTLSNDDYLSSVFVKGATVDISNGVYDVTLSSNAASVPVRIITDDPDARVAIQGTDLSGTHDLSGSLSLPNEGPNPFTITVVAPNGANATYLLTITRPSVPIIFIDQAFVTANTALVNGAAYVVVADLSMNTPFLFEGSGAEITVDGSGHTITVPDQWPGLFNKAVSVSNLGILSSGQTSLYDGWFFQNGIGGTATNCYSTGSISVGGGGIFGAVSAGSATNCYSTGSIGGGGGGIFGAESAGSATNCYSTGAIHENGGGILGFLSHGSATNCHSTGTVHYNSGGIIGFYSSGTATNCYSIGTIGHRGGGIFGAQSTGSATNCYSMGAIGPYGGGIVGYNSSCSATNCYSIGTVGPNAGSIFGAYSNTQVAHCYSTSGELWSDVDANNNLTDIPESTTPVWSRYNNNPNTPYLLVSNPQSPSNDVSLLTVVVNGATCVASNGSYAYVFHSNASTIPISLRAKEAHAIVSLQDISGRGYVSGSLTIQPGSYSFTITVTAPTGATATYTLLIYTPINNALLSSVSVNGTNVEIVGELCNISLPSNAASAPFELVTDGPNSTVQVLDLSGIHDISGSLSLSNTGPNSFSITVVAPSGATKTYTLTITNPLPIVLIDQAFVDAHTALTNQTNYVLVADLSMNTPFLFSEDCSGIAIDGSGHTITVPDQWPGLFSKMVFVSNLGVLSTGQVADGMGWFFHENVEGTATNCYSTGAIGQNSGGLFGANTVYGNAINCYSTGTIGNNGGGLFGPNSIACMATACYSTGSIAEQAGGLFGYSATDCSSIACYSTGSIGPYAGGLFGGGSTGSATNCYSTGSIGAGGGGIFQSGSSGTVIHCYSTNGGLWIDADANNNLTDFPDSASPPVWFRYNDIPDTPYLLIANPQPPSSDDNLLKVVVNGFTCVVNDGSYAYTFDSNASTIPIFIVTEEPHAIVSVGDLSGGGDVSGSLTGLLPGSNTFTITVTAQTGATATYPLTIDTLPAPPTNISGTPGNSSITLSWSPPIGTVTGYKLYTSVNGGDTFVLNKTTTDTTASATITGLMNGITYTCIVQSVNKILRSFYSSRLSLTPIDLVRITNFRASDLGDGSVRFSWDATGTRPISYRLSSISRDGASNEVYTHVATTTDTSVRVTGLSGGPFGYVLQSIQNGVTSAIIRCIPSMPQNLTRTQSGYSLILNWSPPRVMGYDSVTANLNYRLYVSVNGSPFAGINVLGLTSPYRITTMLGSTYRVQMTATSAEGESDATSTPNAPTHVTCTSTAPRTVLITWMPPTMNGGGVVSNYTVYGPDSVPITLNIVFNETSATITKLMAGSSYHFTVSATNVTGTGPASEPSNTIVMTDIAITQGFNTPLSNGTYYVLTEPITRTSPFTFSGTGEGITFDGNGHSITVNNENWPGLFNKPITVTRLRILSSLPPIASAGWFFSSGIGGSASYCYSTGPISGKGGGIFGQNSSGTASYCYSTGAIGEEGGGIFGYKSSGTATKCYSTGYINKYAAGIFGTSSTGTAIDCYTTGPKARILSIDIAGSIFYSGTMNLGTSINSGHSYGWYDSLAEFRLNTTNPLVWNSNPPNTPYTLLNFIPSEPVGLTATSYANLVSYVQWSAPMYKGESDITEYIVTASPDNITVTTTNRFLLLTELRNRVEYTIGVTATNATDRGVTAFTTITPGKYLSAPRALQGGVQNQFIQLSWSAPDHGTALKYNIYQSVNGEAYTLALSTHDTSTTNINILYISNRVYTFTVTAEDELGEGIRSDPTESISTYIPTGFYVTPVNENALFVRFYWTAPTYLPIGNQPYRYSIYDLTANTYITTSAVSGDLVACIGARHGYALQTTTVSPSNYTHRLLDIYCRPTTPSTPSVTQLGANLIVSWSPPFAFGDNLMFYKLFQSSDNITYNILYNDIPSTQKTFLPPRQSKYYFKVLATNTGGISNLSNASNSIVPVYHPLPPIPLHATSLESSTVILSWTAPINTDIRAPIQSYVVGILNGTTITTNIVNITYSGTTATIRGLTDGTRYTFVVAAVNAIGQGDFSTPFNVVVPNVPLPSIKTFITSGSLSEFNSLITSTSTRDNAILTSRTSISIASNAGILTPIQRQQLTVAALNIINPTGGNQVSTSTPTASLLSTMTVIDPNMYIDTNKPTYYVAPSFSKGSSPFIATLDLSERFRYDPNNIFSKTYTYGDVIKYQRGYMVFELPVSVEGSVYQLNFRYNGIIALSLTYDGTKLIDQYSSSYYAGNSIPIPMVGYSIPIIGLGSFGSGVTSLSLVSINSHTLLTTPYTYTTSSHDVSAVAQITSTDLSDSIVVLNNQGASLLSGTGTIVGSLPLSAGLNNFSIRVTPSTGNASASYPLLITSQAPGPVPCFPAGTRILTPTGYKAVETLAQNELVLTADGRPVPIKLYGKHLPVTTSDTAPYRVPKGTFGLQNDLLLSPDHAFQIRKGLWMLPKRAALLSDRVEQVGVGSPVTYYHLECPQYLRDNLVVDGAVVESYAGKQLSQSPYTYNEGLKGYTRSAASNVKRA